MKECDNILAFSAERQEVSVQAGISLQRLNCFLVRRGFFLRVTPGSQYISVGGAIAADAHGKNHLSEGSFSNTVKSMRVLTGSGESVVCSASVNNDLFRASCGGLGLTGCIIEATLALLPIKSSRMQVRSQKCRALSETLESLIETAYTHHYAVSWLDGLAKGRSLGKGVVSGGEHLETGERLFNKKSPFKVPFMMPSWLINRGSLFAFNQAYYHKTRLTSTPSLAPFFYPLDALGHWPRLYGREGLLQHQSLFPVDSAEQGLHALLTLIHRKKMVPSLIVGKVLGAQNSNPLSFAREGISLAIDFRGGQRERRAFAELDECVLAHKGRINLAKDSLMSLETFHACYPEWQGFRETREKWGASKVFQSYLSKRLEL
jgi:FAD/FMN-containing dehydrogenase